MISMTKMIYKNNWKKKMSHLKKLRSSWKKLKNMAMFEKKGDIRSIDK